MYLGQYTITISNHKLEFPFDFYKEQFKWALVHDEYTYLMIDCDEIEDGHILLEGTGTQSSDVWNFDIRLDDFLTGELVLVGAGKWIEVWKKEDFDRYCHSIDQTFEQIFEIEF